MNTNSSSIIQKLQFVFVASLGILIISSYASFYSIQQLIESSKWVNHTNEVLVQTDNIISGIKDAETGIRGYLITNDESFLKPYKNSRASVDSSIAKVKFLTSDNATQQPKIDEVKRLTNNKYFQLQWILHIDSIQFALGNYAPFSLNKIEMIKARNIMDSIRTEVKEMQGEEQRLLKIRMSSQTKFITYTPVLVVIAAILSIIITFFSYRRIKEDMEKRIAEQKLAEEEYIETGKRIGLIEGVTQKIANGDYSVRSLDEKRDELGRISQALNHMTESLESTFNELERVTWLQTGAVKVSDAMRGKTEIKQLADAVLAQVVDYVSANIATFYLINHEGQLELLSSHAVTKAIQTINMGDGVAGQGAINKKTVLLTDLPTNYLTVSSTLGQSSPVAAMVIPIIHLGETIAVIELGFLHPPTLTEQQLLDNVNEAIGIGINTSLTFKQIKELLERSQVQSEELQAQHSELESMNAELEAQAQKLQASEEELRVQQEELQQTNQELEERSNTLQEKTEMILERNIEIQRKADELAQSTKYKSEFLANMSHELRTPLNSILLLSKLLSENNDKNLTTDQVEFAQVIQSSGSGLLVLIDEILDLSKIESGKMLVEYSSVSVAEITSGLKMLFSPIAKDKGLELKIEIDKKAVNTIETDRLRLEQILKNLLSNALKFTSKGGSVHFIIEQGNDDKHITFKVKDTGIGIAKEKQHLIFEAFQQADGSTRRKYGGTGLGLSISRELAKLLNGEITLKSELNVGSEFTLTIPIAENIKTEQPTASSYGKEIEIPKPPKAEKRAYISDTTPDHIPDDRNNITDSDKVILIVEDDTNFAKALLRYAHDKGFKGVVAVSGDEGIDLASKLMPFGILLDIQLPVKSGWEVMDELKANVATRHIPVHIMSSHEARKESMLKGAIDFINKPVAFEKLDEIFHKIESVISKKNKKVLIVEENPKHAKALAYFLQAFDIVPEITSTIGDGISKLKTEGVDCVILDMGLPAEGGYETLETVKTTIGLENLPIIVFTGKSLSKTEQHRLQHYTDSIVMKTAHSYKRILDEVAIFLHLVEKNTPAQTNKSKYPMLGALDEVLQGKTVLIAEDDVRNIFSLTKVLELHKMKVLSATDGKEAVEMLKANPDTSIVLMDIMMPEMDGYQAMQQIRSIPKYSKLPIIAVTAKTMVEDREKCINAGASDYISKPVDIDQLLALLRVWLYEK